VKIAIFIKVSFREVLALVLGNESADNLLEDLKKLFNGPLTSKTPSSQLSILGC